MPDPPAPDDKRIFLLARKMGLEAGDAYTFVQELQNMAAANLIVRFESKLDAKFEGLNAKFDGLKEELQRERDHRRLERRITWALVGLLGAAVIRYLITG